MNNIFATNMHLWDLMNKNEKLVITIFMELTAQKGKGDRGKRTSDLTQTRDLRSITEF